VKVTVKLSSSVQLASWLHESGGRGRRAGPAGAGTSTGQLDALGRIVVDGWRLVQSAERGGGAAAGRLEVEEAALAPLSLAVDAVVMPRDQFFVTCEKS